MAPEVIKNTGLKIGHRLTAEDDRNLLGSTMSANPTQLEQMATFLPGEALVTYEGLLRPFKAQISQWENGTASYESPSNDALVNALYAKDGYRYLLKRSAEICCEKFITEQERIKIEVDSFLRASDNHTAAFRDIQYFMVENNLTEKDIADINSDDALVIKVKERSVSLESNQQLLETRLINIFSQISELMVKVKGYLFQNKAHRKQTMELLLALALMRNNLCKDITGLFTSFVEAYEDFSDEMAQWSLSAIMDDVDV
jgi:transcriptional regulator with XRE-family HTH domain